MDFFWTPNMRPAVLRSHMNGGAENGFRREQSLLDVLITATSSKNLDREGNSSVCGCINLGLRLKSR